MHDLSVDISFRYSREAKSFYGVVVPHKIGVIIEGARPVPQEGLYPTHHLYPGETVCVPLPYGKFSLSYKKDDKTLDYEIEGVIQVYLSINGFPYASYARDCGLKYEGLVWLPW